jgi:hypothetical protein
MTTNMKDSLNLVIFKTITDFVNELSEHFGDKMHELKLYQRLLEKTKISQDKFIDKHITLFRNFCFSNREMIINKDHKKLSTEESVITYSEKVFINFKTLFGTADKDSRKVIIDHLLAISALVDPTAKAKDILKNSGDSSKESDFLTDIIEKVEENVNLKSNNPLEAVSSLISSGVFTDLLSDMNNGLQDGSLNLGKLVGTVEKLCSSMGPPGASGGLDGLNISGLLSGLSAMGNSKGGDGGVIDPTAMITQLTNPSFNPDIGK